MWINKWIKGVWEIFLIWGIKERDKLGSTWTISSPTTLVQEPVVRKIDDDQQDGEYEQ